MIYLIQFIVAFIGGFATGLFVNFKYFWNGLISGTMIAQKGRYSYTTSAGYERLGSFRARFLGFFGLLFTVGYIIFVWLLLYDVILIHPFNKNLSNTGFYLIILGYVLGWYSISKMKKGPTIREQLGIKDTDIK